MHRLLNASAAVALLMICAVPANSQPPRYSDRGPRDDRYHEYGRAALDRVRADLDNASRNLHYIAPEDLRRFHSVREGLANFQRAWERGRYNGADLDRGIRSLQSLVERGRLRPRDRDMLAGDVSQLRDLQRRLERRR